MSHDAFDLGEMPHSHKRHYLIVAAVLTVVTIIEVAALFVPGVKGTDWIGPALFVMAIGKFALVVGEFMHLRDDRFIYKFLFVSPLFLACFSFVALGVLAVVHYAPFGGGYALTARDLKAGFVPPSGGPAYEPPPAADKFQAMYAEAETGGFAKGKEIFAKACANCHRGDAGGMPALGPNLTDDCYKHGGKLDQLYVTIAKGVQGTAMPAWSTSIDAASLRAVSMFVRSLKGKNVANGLECVGDKVVD
jgi:caa(3)-type oxidase subunit IV